MFADLRVPANDFLITCDQAVIACLTDLRNFTAHSLIHRRRQPAISDGGADSRQEGCPDKCIPAARRIASTESALPP
jgi:hypothetical protein